jgi:CRP-like cAMP-binding protein
VTFTTDKIDSLLKDNEYFKGLPPGPRRALAEICLVMKKLRYLTGRLHSATAADVETRFFRFLEERYGPRREYRIDLSKKEIAAAVGSTPETFSRLIARLSRQGRISWRGDNLKILTGGQDKGRPGGGNRSTKKNRYKQ